MKKRKKMKNEDINSCVYALYSISSRLLCLTLEWIMLDLFVILFCCIACKCGWILCIAQVVIPVCAASRQQHMWILFLQMHKSTLSYFRKWAVKSILLLLLKFVGACKKPSSLNANITFDNQHSIQPSIHISWVSGLFIFFTGLKGVQ